MNSAPPKLTRLLVNLASVKLISPLVNRAPSKLIFSPEKTALIESDLPTGENGAREVSTVFKKYASEVEVSVMPGESDTVAQVRGYDLDDSVADLPVRQETQPRLPISRIQSVRHSQVTAQYINTGLAAVFPVIGQPRNRIYPCQPDGRRLIIAKHVDGRCEPLVESPHVLLFQGLVQLLALRLYVGIRGLPI